MSLGLRRPLPCLATQAAAAPETFGVFFTKLADVPLGEQD